MSNHFWYCQSVEENWLASFCFELDLGIVRQFSVPIRNTCRVPVNGEITEIVYTFCGDTIDAYDRFPGCADKVYLGEGEFANSRYMTIREIKDRMEELGMVIPDRLRMMAR